MRRISSITFFSRFLVVDLLVIEVSTRLKNIVNVKGNRVEIGISENYSKFQIDLSEKMVVPSQETDVNLNKL